MQLDRRLMFVAALLGLGLVAQFVLSWHLRQAGDAPFPPLKHELASLPGDIQGWQGAETGRLEELHKILPFETADLLSRVYVGKGGGPPASVYMVYTHTGEDRNHHPEICIREVGGKPEIREGRAIVFLDPEQKRPCERMMFQTGTGEFTTVYYWHYTIHPVLDEGQSGLQRLHLMISKPSPSITVQVSTVARGEQLLRIEKEFLPALDAAMRAQILPEGHTAGCERKMIATKQE